MGPSNASIPAALRPARRRPQNQRACAAVISAEGFQQRLHDFRRVPAGDAFPEVAPKIAAALGSRADIARDRAYSGGPSGSGIMKQAFYCSVIGATPMSCHFSPWQVKIRIWWRLAAS
jgi:hypothetical protein